MVVPPKTWQQLLEISQFFAGKNWDSHNSQPDEGTVLHLKVGEQGHYHFQSLSASFAITPGDRVDRYHNVYWFDPTDMKPLINSPGHVAALEFLQQLNETGPAEQIGWRLPQAWEYFLRGKAVFMYTWGDLGALCQDETHSNVKGNCAATVLPELRPLLGHGEKDLGRDRRAALRRQHHGRLLARRDLGRLEEPGGGLLVSRPDGDQARLALERRAWLDRRRPRLLLPVPEAGGPGAIADYVKAGWDTADVTDYLNAFYRNYTAPTMLTYLRIRGTQEYWSELDSQVGAALGGRKSAKQALDDTAAAWEAI